MKVAIVDASYPIGSLAKGIAANWLYWWFRNHKIPTVSIVDADIIAVTITDPRDCSIFGKIKKITHSPIVAGGPGALSPYSIGMHCDAVCVGDGDEFLSVLIYHGLDAAKELSQCWVNGAIESVIPATGFPWDLPPVEGEDGSYRVYCGIGCKRRCKFCQTGWGQRYAENPDHEKLLNTIRALEKQKKKISFLSNDPSQHSFYHRLPQTGHGSYTLDSIRKNGLPHSRLVRIGVEGVSERLRKLVGKPISSNDLVKSASWLCQNGKQVRWFLIAGLPYETDDDWDDIEECVQRWKRITPKGVIALSFTAFQPEPATPWCVEPLDDEYQARVEKFRHWFFDGPGWSNRVKVYFPAQPKSRNESAIARMGLKLEELRQGGNLGPNNRVQYPYREQRDRLIQSKQKLSLR